jgi:hypothetical protein
MSVCRITTADSRSEGNELERKRKRQEKNETHTGNIIRLYKVLSSWHYLGEDNQGKLPVI